MAVEIVKLHNKKRINRCYYSRPLILHAAKDAILKLIQEKQLQ